MSYIGRGLQSGAFRQLDSIESSFDGSTTGFTMQVNSTNVIMGDANQILLSLGGVIQKPGTDFTISSSTLTFTTAPAANTSFFAILLGSDNGGTTTPTDGSVTGDKLASTVTTSSNISLDGGTFVFNESGADKDFRIEGDTKANLFFADASTDRVGINTNAPDMFLDITGTVTAGAGSDEKLQQWNIDSDNVKAEIEYLDASANRGYAIGTSSQHDFHLRTHDTIRLKVDYTGKVGVNETGTLASQFHVTAPSGFSQYIVDFDNASTSAPYGLFQNYSGAAPDSGSDYEFFKCQDTGGARFIVYSDGDVKNHDNSYGSLSDERIKQNITDANSQWNDIKAIKVRNFKRKDDVRQYGEDKAKIQIGLIAQELESVSSSLVDEAKPSSFDILSSSEFGTLYQDGDDIPEGKEIGDVKEVKENVKGIKYSVLYMKAIKALQEAMARIEALEAK